MNTENIYSSEFLLEMNDGNRGAIYIYRNRLYKLSHKIIIPSEKEQYLILVDYLGITISISEIYTIKL